MTRTVPRSPATLPVGLSPEEAAAVAVALAAQPDGPYAAAGRLALDKVLAALEPDPRRREALRASTRLVRAEAGRAEELRTVVEQGLAERRVLVLAYRDGSGVATHRAVEPLLIGRTGDREYLVAWCRERQALRWFRWDRIEGAELTGETAPRRNPQTLGAPPAERQSAHREPAGSSPTDRHPAGKALRDQAADEPRPRLVVLPGGRTGE